MLKVKEVDQVNETFFPNNSIRTHACYVGILYTKLCDWACAHDMVELKCRDFGRHELKTLSSSLFLVPVDDM